MKIILDLQPLQSISKTRGIGRYTLSLTRALMESAGQHDIYAVFNHVLSDDLQQDIRQVSAGLDPDKILTWRSPLPVSGIDPANINRARAAEQIRAHFLKSLAPDIVHLCSLFEGWTDNTVTSVESFLDAGFSTTVTLHDLIPLIYKQHYLKSSVLRQWYARKVYHLKQSNLLLAISESAKKEALELLDFSPEQVINSSSDADPQFGLFHFQPGEADKLKKDFAITRPFIMYTGGDDPRKNVEKLVLAFASLPANMLFSYQLLVVYKQSPDEKKRYLALAKKLGLKPHHIIFPGYVSDDDLNKLYNLCWLFVFPSEHEGFGLPILEAMRCGAPVIGSNCSSIPEVVGRTDALFEPNIKAIADKIHQVLDDESFRQELIEHGKIQQKKFSWKNTAARHLEAFESLYEQKHNTRETHIKPLARPKLAYISPLPPENSGIADYSAELLPELARYYQIDLITTAQAISDDYLLANFKMVSVEQFKQTAYQYHRILYHFGNSSFHLHMFQLLEEYPGTVILHDFYLGDAILSIDSFDRSAHYFQQQLYQSHGYSALDYLQQQGIKKTIQKYPCNLNVIENAMGLIVHSSHSMSLFEKTYAYHPSKYWSVLPLARKSPYIPDRKLMRLNARTSLSMSEEIFLACSFGDIVDTKQSLAIVNAWINSSLTAHSQCELFFVGTPKDSAYEQKLRHIIRQSGCSARIHMTGYVKNETYHDYLAAADIAIQLRSDSRGETSISILDTLAYGLPTIINAHGAFAEIPDEIVYKLEDRFEPEQLEAALDRFYTNKQHRYKLNIAGVNYVKKYHSPAIVARNYSQAIESFAASHPLMQRQVLFNRLSEIEGLEESDLIQAAIAVDENEASFEPQCAQQLLVDISVLVNIDANTGIQRVVKNILVNLIRQPPAGVRVEPVYRVDGRYKYAREYIQTWLKLQADSFPDMPVDIQKGDLYLGLDLDLGLTEDKKAIEYLLYQQQRGLKMYFLVYDLLPVMNSAWFPSEVNQIYTQWLKTIVKLGNGFHCISHAVALSLQHWMLSTEHYPEKISAIKSFHLGADIPVDQAALEKEIPALKIPVELFSQSKKQITLLMVGTLEPRKGYQQALSAMELLWRQGVHANLIIAGKSGWKMDTFIEVLEDHPQKDKRLFWLDGISDAALLYLYQHCSALLNPSAGEGFGLPLIEAAQAGLPIIARDLAVFQEVAGEHAFYFSGYDAQSLASSIIAWIELYQGDKHPQSHGLKWLSWEQSASQLLKCLELDLDLEMRDERRDLL